MIIEFIQNNLWLVHVVHFLLAVLLFFLINWIGKNSISIGYMQMSVVLEEDPAPAFNFIYKAIGPVVYLVLCIVAFQSLDLKIFVERCYLIVVYYWGFRLLWNLLSNRFKLINWYREILYWCSSIGLSFWLYKNIESLNSILPSGQGLVDQMWILIAAFLYALINQIHMGEARAIKRKDNYINSRYKKFKSKYGNIIEPFFQNHFYEALTYSIMIYEDFNRPFMIRMIEYAKFFITRKPLTLGIMQVTTDRCINDKQSVNLAIRMIKENIDSYLTAERANLEEGETLQIYTSSLIHYVAQRYNGGDGNYGSEISKVFDKLNEIAYQDSIPYQLNIA